MGIQRFSHLHDADVTQVLQCPQIPLLRAIRRAVHTGRTAVGPLKPPAAEGEGAEGAVNVGQELPTTDEYAGSVEGIR